MNLNLHILQKELSHYHWEISMTDQAIDLPCAYPQLCQTPPLQTDRQILYVLNTQNLPLKTDFTEPPSFLCVGLPPKEFLTARCNILYTEDNISPETLLNTVLMVYNKYNQWEHAMQSSIDSKESLSALGKLAMHIFQNPLYCQGTSFRCLFQALPPAEEWPHNTWKNYVQNYAIESNTYMGMEDINILINDPEYLNARDLTEPTFYSGKPYGFRSLFYNVSNGNTFIARLCIDEILHPITPADYSLIKIWGKYVAKGLQGQDVNRFDRPIDLNNLLHDLLIHHFVREEKIINVLQTYQWNVDDDYFCMLLTLKSAEQDHSALSALALQLSLLLPSDCFIVFKEQIVFIFNLTQIARSREDVMRAALPCLRDNLLFAGISTTYHDFKELYYYYQQAHIAFNLGMKINPSFWYYRFEDYNLEYFIQKCGETLIPSALIPEGMKRLLDYDKKNHTEYTSLLRIYLEHDRNIAETTRAAYIHRNTCLYRLGRIHEIAELDLDDSNVRLTLLLSFKLLEHSVS